MAAAVARERGRPMREDTRQPDRDKDGDNDEDDENYDPRTDPNHDDYDPDYDPANDEGGNAAPTDGDGDEPMTSEEAREMKKSLDSALAKIDKLEKALNPVAEINPDDFITETYTSEALMKGIGSEFGLALAPLVARLEALEEQNEALQKALEQHGVILEEVSDKQEVIKKALGGVSPEQLTKALAAKETETAAHTPAEGETTPTGAVTADDILTKGADGDALSDSERTEAQELLVKAQSLVREHSIFADGYEDAVDAMNEGRFSRQVLSALRKGIDVASANADRLIKA